MSMEAVVVAVANAEPVMDDKLLEAVTIHDLLAREFPPREWLLEPAIPSQGLAMLYGPRGMGKTLVGMGIAYAVASGGEFLKFKAAKARKVLYVDGEMPAVAMQERCAALVEMNTLEPPSPNFLRFITPVVQDTLIPDLATAEGQLAI